ncbi:HNH endonuclease [Paraburkholderia sp. A3RO-2L]|jgi:5-methylcytosine-specific restriction endonuclease McrA|uniref:HNH endonuclease n=1 Tax=Paraburkholderia sp. A3RO-2L TaxID=3028376 RepID=UPI003DA83F51
MHQVLTLDQGGRPSRWSSWEEAIVYKVKGLIAWSLGDETPYHGGVSRLTGEDTVVTVPNIIAVANEVFDGRIPLTNHNLFNRDNYICCYCGNQFCRGQLTREHIVPTSRGGANNWMNCATACKTCNNRKSDALLEELGWKLLYVPYVPTRAEALILAGRNIQSDQMQYLRDCLAHNSPLLTRVEFG